MKNKKRIIGKLILFIILASLVVFLFFFFKDKDDTLEPSEPSAEEPNNPNEPEEPVPDQVGTNYLNNVSGEVDEAVQKVVVEFLNVYYNSIKNLEENDPPCPAFSDQNALKAFLLEIGYQQSMP